MYVQLLTLDIKKKKKELEFWLHLSEKLPDSRVHLCVSFLIFN